MTDDDLAYNFGLEVRYAIAAAGVDPIHHIPEVDEIIKRLIEEIRSSALTNTSAADEAPVVASGVTPGQYEFAAERLTLSIEGELDGLCIEMDVARRIVDFVLTETFGRAPA